MIIKPELGISSAYSALRSYPGAADGRDNSLPYAGEGWGGVIEYKNGSKEPLI